MEEKEGNGTMIQMDNSSCIRVGSVSFLILEKRKEPEISKFLAFGKLKEFMFNTFIFLVTYEIVL